MCLSRNSGFCPSRGPEHGDQQYHAWFFRASAEGVRGCSLVVSKGIVPLAPSEVRFEVPENPEILEALRKDALM